MVIFTYCIPIISKSKRGYNAQTPTPFHIHPTDVKSIVKEAAKHCKKLQIVYCAYPDSSCVKGMTLKTTVASSSKLAHSDSVKKSSYR